MGLSWIVEICIIPNSIRQLTDPFPLPMAKSKLLLIDGNSLMHRAWHALPPMKDQQGQMVQAVYGFLTTFFKVLETEKPTHCVVAFDEKGPTKRHEKFKEYKAQRVKKPDEFYTQFNFVKQILLGLDIHFISRAGYEADDIIGTLAKMGEGDYEVLILTGDLDTLQLVDKNISVLTFARSFKEEVRYNPEKVKERFGCPPEALPDWKALAGDQSDNIPGVSGLGEKSASNLIGHFGSLEKLYQVAEKKSLTPPLTEALQKKLLADKQAAFLGQELTTIILNTPLDKFKLADSKLHLFDPKKSTEALLVHNFKSLVERLPKLSEKLFGSYGFSLTPTLFDKTEIKTKAKREALGKILEQIKKEKILALTFEVDQETSGISLGVAYGKNIFATTVALAEYKMLSVALKEASGVLVVDGLKNLNHLLSIDFDLPNVWDIQLVGYVLNPGLRQYGLEGRGLINLPLPEQASELLKIYESQKQEMIPALMSVYETIERPLTPVLAQMEKNGVRLDVSRLEKSSQAVQKKILELEKKILSYAGKKELNVRSPQQLSWLLFEHLGLSTAGVSKTISGYSTAVDVLELLAGKHPVIALILEHRELSKLRSTYLEPLPKLVDKDQRLHTTYQQTVAATGRLSSIEPNLQNIPHTHDDIVHMRAGFIAPKGKVLVACDYSQLELRIVANLSGDKIMQKSFQESADIHARTASLIFAVPESEVTPAQRRKAKEVNFGVLYGMGSWGLSQRTDLTAYEAKQFIEKYFSVFPRMKKFLEEIKEGLQEKGYVSTFFGRRRQFPELYAGSPQARAAAERMAVNLPMQGTAADLMKLAMIKVFDKFKTGETKMLLQVHDELVLEAPVAEAKIVAQEVKAIMESVCPKGWVVPLTVEAKIGENWGSMRSE